MLALLRSLERSSRQRPADQDVLSQWPMALTTNIGFQRTRPLLNRNVLPRFLGNCHVKRKFTRPSGEAPADRPLPWEQQEHQWRDWWRSRL